MRMKIYLATWLFESNQGEALTKMGKRERLISYYHTITKKEELPEYVRSGRNEGNEGSKK
jgi:hypothetical protein